MRIFVLLIAILLFQERILADPNQIVAIVGKEPITLSKLEQRKKLIKFFNDVPRLSPEQEKIFTNNILQTMIDDEILLQYAAKSRIPVSEQEIKNFIKHIEANNKMPEGQLEKSVANLHITSEDLYDKMRVEVLRSKIIHEMLGRQVRVSKGDVDSLILDTNSRDATLSFKVFTARYSNSRIYKSMAKLSSKAKDCKKTAGLRYHSFATMSDLDTTLSALPSNVQGLVKDMAVGQATGVVKGDKLQVFLLCSKNVENFSNDEINQVSQLVANKQLNIKARTFLQNLRKKTYVRIIPYNYNN